MTIAQARRLATDLQKAVDLASLNSRDIMR
jgi:hypothetical protein